MSDDKKIQEFLKRNIRPCPPAPQREYQSILEHIEEENKPIMSLWKWVGLFGTSVALGVLLFVSLPYFQTSEEQVLTENTQQVEELLQETFSDYASSFEEDEIL